LPGAFRHVREVSAVTTIRVTDQTSRAEIEEAIVNVLASMRRLPGVEGYRARGHERINALLDELDRLPKRAS